MTNFNHPDFLHNSNPKRDTSDLFDKEYRLQDKRNFFSFNQSNFNKKFFAILFFTATAVALINYICLTLFSFGPVVSSILIVVNMLIGSTFLAKKLSGPLNKVSQCFNQLKSGTNTPIRLRKNDFYQEIIEEYNSFLSYKNSIDKNTVINLNNQKSRRLTSKRKSA